MPNIVKHSFIKGPKIASRAMAHLNYIQHRPGEDKEHGKSGERDPARPLRGPWDDDSAPGKSAQDFKQALYDKDERGRVVHKFILSPSEKDVNMDRYTQEMMSAIGRQKGQDLNYRWVVHGNTDNPHAHVVVMGKDLEGSDVRFSKLDYALMRHYGDRYLEREHGVELNLGKDRDIEMYARTHAHNLYTESTAKTLKFLEEPEKKRSWISDEDFRHLLLINRNWNESLEGPSREGHLTLGETWMHDRGRLSEVHDLFQNSSNRDLWNDVHANTSDQELKDYAAKQVATLDDQRQAVMKEMGEKLGLTPDKHDQFFRDLQEQFADEWREIDQALYPEKYLPQEIDRKDIDLGRIDAESKIQLANGEWISKYDSGHQLDEVRKDLMKGDYSDRLPPDEYSKLCSWIGTKQAHGDDCFGIPPLRDNIELEKSFDINDLDTRPVSLDGLSKELALDSKSLEDLVSPRLESPELKELGEIDRTHSISIEDALDAREPNSQALDQTLESIDRDDPEIDLVAIEKDLSPADKAVQDLEPPYQVSYDVAGDKDPDIEKDPDLDFEPPDFDHDLTQDQIEQTDDYEIESTLDIDNNGGEDYELDDTPDRSDTPERGDDDEHRRSGDSGR
jgi:hypothetical protein